MTGLFTGSHGRDELHVLHGADEHRPPTRKTARKICRVCGDEIGLKENGELFVACYECGFPVCRPCYEYERSEGHQCCPQCNTRYKRHKGCARVAGDDEENYDADDFDDEFQTKNHQDSHPNQQRFDAPSENGDHNQQQQWHPNGPAFSSVAGSVTGKDFEGDKETYTNAEWKERVDKWKTRQEKKGLVSKGDDGGSNLGDGDEYL